MRRAPGRTYICARSLGLWALFLLLTGIASSVRGCSNGQAAFSNPIIPFRAGKVKEKPAKTRVAHGEAAHGGQRGGAAPAREGIPGAERPARAAKDRAADCGKGFRAQSAPPAPRRIRRRIAGRDSGRRAPRPRREGSGGGLREAVPGAERPRPRRGGSGGGLREGIPDAERPARAAKDRAADCGKGFRAEGPRRRPPPASRRIGGGLREGIPGAERPARAARDRAADCGKRFRAQSALARAREGIGRRIAGSGSGRRAPRPRREGSGGGLREGIPGAERPARARGIRRRIAEGIPGGRPPPASPPTPRRIGGGLREGIPGGGTGCVFACERPSGQTHAPRRKDAGRGVGA